MKIGGFFNAFGKKIKNIEPHHLILLGIAVVFFLLYLFNSAGTSRINYKVNYEESPLGQLRKKKANEDKNLRMGENDPHARLASRVLEANAITLGLLQYTVYQKVVERNEINDIELLMRGFAVSDLKPPSTNVLMPVKKSLYGTIMTSRGAYYIRYQPKPLVIEVLSSGSNSSDGAVFVIRAPDNAALPVAEQNNIKSAAWATLYVSPELESASIPPAFSAPDVYQTAGWSVEPLRVSDISAEKLEAIKKLLAAAPVTNK